MVRDKAFADVDNYGWHYYRILGGPTPSWSYSIGFEKSFGCPEVVMAGTSYFSRYELADGFRDLADRVRSGEKIAAGSSAELHGLGACSFQPVDASWAKHLLLGDLDYYAGLNFRALQLIQSSDRLTMDVPNLSRPFEPETELPWRWLVEKWPYPIAGNTSVSTDLEALRGRDVTMVVRHKPGGVGTEWDAIALEDTPVPDELARAAPFGTLLAVDPTIGEVLGMGSGHWATRDEIGDPWEIREF